MHKCGTCYLRLFSDFFKDMHQLFGQLLPPILRSHCYSCYMAVPRVPMPFHLSHDFKQKARFQIKQIHKHISTPCMCRNPFNLEYSQNPKRSKNCHSKSCARSWLSNSMDAKKSHDRLEHGLRTYCSPWWICSALLPHENSLAILPNNSYKRPC